MNYETILEAALKELGAAVKKIMEDTVPATPKPRFRVFHIADRVVWPRWSDEGPIPEYVSANGKTYFLGDGLFSLAKEAASAILKITGYQPRKILRALRRIFRAAIAWCEARTEGRQRQAQEILRQQSVAVETLEAEAAMLALK